MSGVVADLHLEGGLGWFLWMALLVFLRVLHVHGAHWSRSSCQQHWSQSSTSRAKHRRR